MTRANVANGEIAQFVDGVLLIVLRHERSDAKTRFVVPVLDDPTKRCLFFCGHKNGNGEVSRDERDDAFAPRPARQQVRKEHNAVHSIALV